MLFSNVMEQQVAYIAEYENVLICEPNSIMILRNVYVQRVHFMYLIRNISMVFKYCDICEVVVLGV